MQLWYVWRPNGSMLCVLHSELEAMQLCNILNRRYYWRTKDGLYPQGYDYARYV